MPSKYTEHDSGIFTSRIFKLDGEPLSGADAEQWERVREYMSIPLFDRAEADARHVLGADIATPEARADAERLLSLIVQMRGIVESEAKLADLREKFSEHTGVRTPGGAPAMQSVAAVAYEIGALHSQLCVRHMEGAALRGKQTIADLDKGRRAQTSRKHERDEAIAVMWKRLRAKFPHYNIGAIDAMVAEEFGVRPATVYRARKNCI